MKYSQSELNEQFLRSAIQGDIEKAIEWLTEGADLNSRSAKGYNAVFLSASRSKKEFFEWILQVEQKGLKIDLNNKNGEGYTLLYDMVRDNLNIFYIEEIVKNGAKVDLPSKDGVTPLLQACAMANLEHATVLLDNGANPNYFIDDRKTTPFLMACAEGDFDLVKLLISHHANIHDVDNFGRNILISALFRPTQYLRKDQKAQHKELMEYIVEQTDLDLNYVAHSGVTALWLASAMKETKLVNKMLDKELEQPINVDVWHQLDITDGKTSALHYWCKFGDAKLVEKFLDKGAKLSVPDEMGNLPESFGFTIPHLRQLLLDRNADINAMIIVLSQEPGAADQIVPAWIQTIYEGDTQKDMVKQMIDKGAKISYEDPQLHRHDPLFVAIKSSAPEIIELLLSQNKIDINKLLKLNDFSEDTASFMTILCLETKNNKIGEVMKQKKMYEKLIEAQAENQKNGVTSEIISDEDFETIKISLVKLNELEKVLVNNQKKIFDSLINSGYDVNLEDNTGKTSLFYCKDTKMAQWLKDAGANLYHKDKEGNDLLSWSVANNHEDMISFLKESLKDTKEAKSLYYNLAFTDGNNSQQQTLLQYGIINFTENEELKKPHPLKKDEEFIVQKIENINYQDSDGNSPIMVACANDVPFLVSLYQKMGADLNLRNNLGETPLMHAIATKNTIMIDFIIKNNGDCDAVTNDGKTTLQFAQETEKLGIEKLIRENMNNSKRPKP